jgi:hypothetical protein
MQEMNLDEFRSEGFLLEVNRQFFHPLGLAIFLRYDNNGNAIGMGIYDWRNDPEGTIYSAFTDGDKEKTERVKKLWDEKAKVRQERFGFIVQPLEGNNESAI